MFKWLGQVHLDSAKHSNWLVKVASAFVVAYGGIPGLNWGATRLFLGLFGSPRPSTQVRLQILDETLEFNKTLFAEKERAFVIRIKWVGHLGNFIPKNDSKNAELRRFLDETINNNKCVIQCKGIPHLYFLISLLESVKVKLLDEDET